MAMSRMKFVTRLWFYFRMGYATYLTFILGYVSTLITVYYLAIKSVPDLLSIFPRFVPFAILATVTGVPLCIGAGWMHYKRSLAYTSEVDIQVEANPYNFKLAPGYNLEVLGPLYLEILVLLKRLVAGQATLNEEDKARIEKLEGKLQVLVKGGMVGTPRKKIYDDRPL
jgi:hypothetical protein